MIQICVKGPEEKKSNTLGKSENIKVKRLNMHVTVSLVTNQYNFK